MEKEIDIKFLWRCFIENWIIILLSGIIGGMAALLISKYIMTPKYTASTQISIYNSDWVSSSGGITSGNMDTSERMLETIIVYFKDDVAASKVSEKLCELGYKDEDGNPTVSSGFVRSSVGFEQIGNTIVMRIVATTVNPKLSADICNTYAAVAPEIIDTYFTKAQTKMLSQAKVPSSPSSPATNRNIMIGILAALVLSYGIIVVFIGANNTVNSESELKEKYDFPILGVIPSIRESKKSTVYGSNSTQGQKRK